MKIVDCFIFYNELDLLNYRLHILNEIVDYFVIVESRHTFIGKKKPLFFEMNKHLFDFCKDKIIHIVVDDFPYIYPNCDISQKHQLKNEIFQSNQIKRGIDIINLDDYDYVIISDLDEIPDPCTLQKIKSGLIHVDFQSLQMDLYQYNLNTNCNVKWNQSKILTFETYKQKSCCQDIRFSICSTILFGGWHLSYFGDEHFIQNKIINFSHQEYNNDYITNINVISKKITCQENLFTNSPILYNISLIDNNYLPYQYDIYLSKFI
jgi:beta-1,4-mannosyl-glycoprotein beta-1,4-N-acetylglucosaminyltransferase